MPATPLEIVDLASGYGLTRVIEGLSLKVPAGARLAILGRNGVGKTTLLATIAGHAHRFGGLIKMGGVELSILPADARARAGLGYVPQTRDVFPSLSVEENLYVGLKGRPRQEMEEAFALFPRLKERRRNLASQLSGGEQQMLAIARTILGKPSLLLLDEPLEGLAPTICDELIAALSKLAEKGDITIVLVEQRIEYALGFADNVVIMDRGRIVWSGPTSDLKAQPQTMDRHIGISRLDSRKG
ncbi:MAG: ABC transporter ATP-binding protein [Rhizobiaceae bacterium]|nr:ABC transporter ATP-binding protein [Rhizobiaceae bacterium]